MCFGERARDHSIIASGEVQNPRTAVRARLCVPVLAGRGVRRADLPCFSPPNLFWRTKSHSQPLQRGSGSRFRSTSLGQLGLGRLSVPTKRSRTGHKVSGAMRGWVFQRGEDLCERRNISSILRSFRGGPPLCRAEPGCVSHRRLLHTTGAYGDFRQLETSLLPCETLCWKVPALSRFSMCSYLGDAVSRPRHFLREWLSSEFPSGPRRLLSCRTVVHQASSPDCGRGVVRIRGFRKITCVALPVPILASPPPRGCVRSALQETGISRGNSKKQHRANDGTRGQRPKAFRRVFRFHPQNVGGSELCGERLSLLQRRSDEGDRVPRARSVLCEGLRERVGARSGVCSIYSIKHLSPRLHRGVVFLRKRPPCAARTVRKTQPAPVRSRHVQGRFSDLSQNKFRRGGGAPVRAHAPPLPLRQRRCVGPRRKSRSMQDLVRRCEELLSRLLCRGPRSSKRVMYERGKNGALGQVVHVLNEG